MATDLLMGSDRKEVNDFALTYNTSHAAFEFFFVTFSSISDVICILTHSCVGTFWSFSLCSTSHATDFLMGYH